MPEQIYQRAWQLVRDGYYDTTFNNQDWNKWLHKYDGKLQTNEQAYAAVNEMFASLNDPYTRFLDPKAYKEESDAINSFVCGIGISLRPYSEAKALIVNEVIEGGPADRAGLVYGDEIVAIDGVSTIGVDGDKAAQKIRGVAGTSLTLKVKHGKDIRECAITRAQVCIPAVQTKILDRNIGYIKLSTFMSDDAAMEFRMALHRLMGTNGLIIDVRNNPGGLLSNAIEIADMLIEDGKIVSTQSRRGQAVDRCRGGYMTDQPIVVLVDRDSASASEILAGALKDHRRATIVGEKTFGKGLVQEINRLPSGCGVHITVARYFTPNGSDINKVGIKPDVFQPNHDKQLASGVEALGVLIAQRGGRDNMVVAPRRYPAFPGSRLISPRG